MRKWLAATMVACLLLPAAIAVAQLPRPSAHRIVRINWRQYKDSGNIDSSAKSLTGVASVDTTVPIPLNDVVYPFNLSAATATGPGPRFFLWTPNTSTADTIYGTAQISPDGTHWFDSGALTYNGTSTPSTNAQFFTGLAANTPSAFSSMPLTFSGHLLNIKTAAQGALPVPWIRLILNGSGTQAFSAARLSMSYLSHQDATGYGLPCSHWKVYSDPSYPLRWSSDSTAQNLAAATPLTTDPVYLGDVDWFPGGAASTSSSNLKLTIWTTYTTANIDSVYVTMETSPDGTHWTQGDKTTVAADHLETSGTTIQWLDLPSTGVAPNSALSVNNATYLAPFARWTVRMDGDGVFPQAHLMLMYPTKDAEQ